MLIDLIRRYLIFSIFLTCCGCSLPFVEKGPVEPITISGVLNGRTVLSGSVEMTGDLLIPAGSELIIRAGTTITVVPSESTKIDPEYLSSQTELLVRGRLLVEGEPDNMVNFVPRIGEPTDEPLWAGIILDGADNSEVRHASLWKPDTGLLIIATSPRVIGNWINRARYGIVVQGGAAKILDNVIADGEGGVFCWDGTTAYLKGNRIVDNEEEGIVVSRDSRPYLDRNRVSGNSIGLIVPADLPYDPTRIAGNGQDIRLLVEKAKP